MAQQQINTIIVLRNDETTAWESTSYRLQKGEVGIGRLSIVKNGETINNVVVKVGAEDENGQLLAWKDLPQVEGVIEEELVLTHNFGRHKTANGKVNAGGEGMTVSQWLRDALSEVLNPKTNYPTATFTANGYVTNTGTNEIGSKIKEIKWKTTVGVGSYVGNDGTGTYGTTNSATSSATGINKTDVSWEISNEKDSAEVTKSGEVTGSFSLAEANWIQIDSTSSKNYTYFNATATIDASKAYVPFNNLGVQYANGQIKGFDKNGTTTKDFTDVAIAATGFRNSWYYVGTDCTSEITGDWIRANGTAMNTSTPNFNTSSKTSAGTAYSAKCMPIPQGTKRIMFAVPGSKSKIEGIDVDGMGLPYDGFTSKTVSVKGANGFTAADYTVFVKENANGLAATGYTVTIS